MSGAINLYLNVMSSIWSFMVVNAILSLGMSLIAINLVIYFFKKLKNML